MKPGRAVVGASRYETTKWLRVVEQSSHGLSLVLSEQRSPTFWRGSRSGRIKERIAECWRGEDGGR
jgi:hypothetical protein